MTCDEIDELAGVIALDAVPPEEWPAIQAHLATCTRGHPEIQDLRRVVTLLLESAPPVEPPAGLRGRILAAARAETAETAGAAGPVPAATAAVMATPAPAPAAAAPTPAPAPLIERRDRAFWRQPGWVAAAAAAVAAVGLGLWALSLNGDLRDTEERLSAAERRIRRDEQALAALAGGRPVAFTSTIPNARGSVLTPARGNAALVIQGLPRSGDQVYQVWALKDGRPTSLGVFSVADDTPTVVTLDQDLQNVDAVAITLEPGPNGSPGPTSTPILAAPLRS